MAKIPLGRLDARAFVLELPRLEKSILEGFRALADLTGTTSDALDECRITGVVPGSTLRPTDPAARIVYGFESEARRGHDPQIRSGRDRGA